MIPFLIKILNNIFFLWKNKHIASVVKTAEKKLIIRKEKEQ